MRGATSAIAWRVAATCWPWGTAARCCCLTPLPAWWLIGSPTERTWSTWASIGSGTLAGRDGSGNSSIPTLRSSFPALRSLDAFPNNLPVQLTPLIGRGPEVRAVGRRLGEDRLLTLTGSGGVGKTRLALAVAAAEVENYRGGVWLVPLAGLTDPDSVPEAALAALGAHQVSGVPSAELVSRELGMEPSLLVLDNCEHLVDGCAHLVAELLVANQATSVLATSREPLGVPGEVTWRVPSLAAPPVENALAVSALSQYDAVRLFLDRARRARPSFAVTEQNAPAIAQILLPPRRDPIGRRTGGGPLPATVGRADRPGTRRPFSAAYRWGAHGPAPPPHPGRVDRLEP